MNQGSRRLGASLLLLLATSVAYALGNPVSAATTPSVARAMVPPPTSSATPPMGWNGYNEYHTYMTASMLEAEARALVSSGMKSAGYNYVILDGGWALPWRNRFGEQQANPQRFPHGLQPVIQYVHSLGLRFGLYTSAGTENCAHTSVGSYGHYATDAATFARWGVDYLKFDWCYIPYGNYPSRTPMQVSQLLARQMATALAATHRRIVLDINDTLIKRDTPSAWAGGFGGLWRTTPDIQDNFASVVHNFQLNERNLDHTHPGAWNDPDMLEAGNSGLTTVESQTQFTLWAEMAAPLIAGTNLTTMSPATSRVLLNRQVIAVDQDPLGIPGSIVARGQGTWVLTKPLVNHTQAIVLFNSTNAPGCV